MLVQCLGRAKSDASCQDFTDFKHVYRAFHLADELFVGEGGSVVNAFIGRQYQRSKHNEEAACQSGWGWHHVLFHNNPEEDLVENLWLLWFG
jgi:hypothetical protein